MVLNNFFELIGLRDFIAFIKKDFNLVSYAFIAFFLVVAIGLNYHFDFEDSIAEAYKNSLLGLLVFLSENLILYIIPLLFMLGNKSVKNAFSKAKFWGALFISLFLLSILQSYNFSNILFDDYNASYFVRKVYNRVNSLSIYVITLIVLGVVIGKSKFKLYGLGEFNIQWKTYFVFLACMIPLLLLATTQDDFLHSYPRLRYSNFSSQNYLGYFLKYEPLYLMEFCFLEWFFRGFMVLFFSKYVGSRSVILIAIIYCAFHFGKPMAECISSFFGGYILGYMVYKNKSIWGGVLVHMGIAFLMDVFAYSAQIF